MHLQLFVFTPVQVNGVVHYPCVVLVPLLHLLLHQQKDEIRLVVESSSHRTKKPSTDQVIAMAIGTRAWQPFFLL